MNGISSEQIIAQRYGDQNLLYCVAMGMDAMRDGNVLQYTKKGKLQIGIKKEEQPKALQTVQAYFDEIRLPYSVENDISHAMWAKYMLNVGINQTCMVYECSYREALENKYYYKSLLGAMNEVIAVGQAEEINLSQKDIDFYIDVLHTLDPNGYPSMRQDALAKRKSEVELFAGTVIKMGEKHSIAVPVNQFYYEKIYDMEQLY